jgi:periodic tryptophan protein 2
MFFSSNCVTFPFENRSNIDLIALSPDSKLLISVDIGIFNLFFMILDGYSIMVNVAKQVILSHYNYRLKKVHLMIFLGAKLHL